MRTVEMRQEMRKSTFDDKSRFYSCDVIFFTSDHKQKFSSLDNLVINEFKQNFLQKYACKWFVNKMSFHNIFSLLYNEMFFFLNQKIGFQVNIILFDNKIDLFSIRKVMFEIYKS